MRWRFKLGLSLCAGLPALGCAPMASTSHQPSVVQTVRLYPPDAERPKARIEKVVALVPEKPPETLPEPKPILAPEVESKPAEFAEMKRPPLPISLDTVLRLAEDQNSQVALARERVREACTESDLAGKRWLPDLYVGPAWYRHEGGIQDFEGNLVKSSTGALFGGMEMNSKFDLRDAAYQKVNAERRLWQQKGELTKITNEMLLDAANTYIDLITAKTGEAIAAEVEKDLRDLLKKTEKLAKVEKSAGVEVARIKAELAGREQLIHKLRQQTEAASAKLAYLLSVDPFAELVPIDQEIVPIELVDATPPAEMLVQQALTSGPGIREMEGMLNLIHESIKRSRGFKNYLPELQMRMAEGAYGAGPNDNMNFDNRWDLGLQARWNLTEYLTIRERKRLALSKITQANLAYQDLRGKLTAGVQEGRSNIRSGGEQIRLARTQIAEARETLRLTWQRHETHLAAPSEVLLAIRGLSLAQLNYLTSINSYDKAQLRMMFLLGCR